MTKEQIHDEQISPLMDQIIAICKTHKIPFIGQFAFDRDPDSEEEDDRIVCTTSLLATDYDPTINQIKAYHLFKPSKASFAAFTITVGA